MTRPRYGISAAIILVIAMVAMIVLPAAVSAAPNTWDAYAQASGCTVDTTLDAIVRALFHLYGLSDAGLSYCAQTFF
jgi:hypothetical protein